MGKWHDAGHCAYCIRSSPQTFAYLKLSGKEVWAGNDVLEKQIWRSVRGPTAWQSLFSLSTLVMGTRYMWTLLPDVLLTSCYLAKKSSLERMSLEKQIWRSVRGPTAPLAELVLVIIIHL